MKSKKSEKPEIKATTVKIPMGDWTDFKAVDPACNFSELVRILLRQHIERKRQETKVA